MNGQSGLHGETVVIESDRAEDGPLGSNAESAAAGDVSPLFRSVTWGRDVAGGLPLTIVYDILKNERRRFVLRYLQAHGGTATTGELAEQIAAYENETPVERLNAQQRKRVYIGLYQCHLPKLADAGVIEFEQSRGNVRLGPCGPALLRFLDESLSEDRNHHRYYHGVVAIGALLLTIHYLVFPELSWLLHLSVFIVLGGVLSLGQFVGVDRGSD